MVSAIGPAWHLREVGVDVVHDAPRVGADLQDHPELYLEYEFRTPTYSTAMRWPNLLKAGLEFLSARRGRATSPASHLLGYLRSSPVEPSPDLPVFSGPWGYLDDTVAFARDVVRRLAPGFDIDDDAALEGFVRDTAGICYHASGTCRMGDDAAAVVDPELRVRGVDRLRVADASIMPVIPSGNLHAPTVMIGERAAGLIREGVERT